MSSGVVERISATVAMFADVAAEGRWVGTEGGFDQDKRAATSDLVALAIPGRCRAWIELATKVLPPPSADRRGHHKQVPGPRTTGRRSDARRPRRVHAEATVATEQTSVWIGSVSTMPSPWPAAAYVAMGAGSLGRAFLDITDFPEKETHQHVSLLVGRCHPADAQDARAARGQPSRGLMTTTEPRRRPTPAGRAAPVTRPSPRRPAVGLRWQR